MTNKLLIVESPSKAKTISKYLNGEYTVRASVGHIRDLPKSNKKAINIDGGYIPHYEISKDKKDVVEEIKKLANKAKEVILATDPDREGEAIAWHIVEACELGKHSNVERVTFHEITEDAIKEALKHPREIDTNLRKAQEARRVLDRLVGYDLSGIVWKKVRYGLSAGRVQSPALRIIMEREREIRAFIPETYFVLEADLKNQKNKTIRFTCVQEPKNLNEAEEIKKLAETGNWKIKNIEKSEAKRSPRAPFTTSTLQQAGSSRLGFSPSKTMSIAQKLYEAGHITYMRTDSTNLSNQAVGEILGLIKKEYGENYLTPRTYKTKSKNAQEAHEAIRPTHANKKNLGNTDEQKKLYRLIWERTVASQMSDALISRTKITANIIEKEIPDFAVNGSQLLFDGWLKADPEGRGDDVNLPEYKENESLSLENFISNEKQTTPPNRYSEAGLVKELEKRGIGRPSTYASIIKTLEDRGYVTKENKALVPTDTGDVVSSFLEEHFNNFISDTFTAKMEDKLDDIANGEAEYIETLDYFYKPLHQAIKSKDDIEKATNLGISEEFKCPKCGSEMHIKLSRSGKFLSCAKFPDCDGALTILGTEIKKDEPIGFHPETNEPIYVKIGRFGPYVQIGENVPKGKGKKSKTENKNKLASIPKEIDPSQMTVAIALKLTSLPRVLGKHPETGSDVIANRGRFGPYVGNERNFRSIKTPDDVYTIKLDRALELLAQEKKPRGFQKKKK